MARPSMGGFGRDYYLFGGAPTFGVKVILAACTAVWILLQIPALGLPMAQWLALVPGAVLTGQVWRLLTYLLLHAGLMHLLFNMLGIYMFGCDLERLWGTRRLASFVVVTGSVAGVLVTVAALIDRRLMGAGVVGISGAVFGLVVAWAMKYPGAQLMFFPFPVMVSARVFAAIWIAIELGWVWSSGLGALGSVAHLGGAAAGYLYVKRPDRRFRLPSLNPFAAYRRWQNRRIARKFKVLVNDIDPETFLRRGDDDRRKLVN